MTEALQRAIEEVYKAFEDVARPGDICMSPFKDPEEFKALLQVPLRKLSDQDLWAYHYSATLTVGTEEDFCYFLPRLLELAAMMETSLDREMVFDKIPRTGWPEGWPERRRRAFQSYMDAVCGAWKEIEVPEMDRWVCALAFCHSDMAACLELLLTDSAAAQRNLLNLFEANSAYLMKERLGNSFWETSSEGYIQVLAWLNRMDVHDRIQHLYGL